MPSPAGVKGGERRRLARLYGIETPPVGCRQIIFHYDASFARCDCVTHRFAGIDCTVVMVYFSPEGDLRRCAACGTYWPAPPRRF